MITNILNPSQKWIRSQCRGLCSMLTLVFLAKEIRRYILPSLKLLSRADRTNSNKAFFHENLPTWWNLNISRGWFPFCQSANRTQEVLMEPFVPGRFWNLPCFLPGCLPDSPAAFVLATVNPKDSRVYSSREDHHMAWLRGGDPRDFGVCDWRAAYHADFLGVGDEDQDPGVSRVPGSGAAHKAD